MTETKEKLLQVAFREFLLQSYKDVTLEQLVVKLGLTKGAFYHHFSSKQDVFTQVVDMYLAGFEQVFSHPYNPQIGLTGNLSGVIEMSISKLKALFVSLGESFSMINFYGFMLEAYKYYPDFNEKVIEMQRQKEISCYVYYINEAKKNKEIKLSVDSFLLAQMLRNQIDGISLNEYLSNEEKDIMTRITEALDFIVELVQK
jgi:AcrR family transcriptional regulator